jgi:hypothetical protein
MTQKLYVIGDKFIKCLVAPNVISQTMLEQRVHTQHIDCNQYAVIVGQGISLKRLLKLLDFIECNQLQNQYQFSLDTLNKKANRSLTHKQCSNNILISEPEQNDEHRFSSFLILDEACSEISDHTHGEHISGMVLIEASRQMTIAVAEKFYLANRTCQLEFVTNSLETQFMQFVFPFEIYLDCTVNSVKGFLNNLKLSLTISIIQNNALCAVVNYVFSVLDAAFLKNEYTDKLLSKLGS